MTPRVMSREFLDRAERKQSSSDPDTATAETVELMCRYANQSAGDPLVQRAANDAVRRYRGGPLYSGAGADPRAIANSVWWYTHSNLKFIHHDDMIRAMWNEPGQLQLLISPEVLLRTQRPAGDCAVYTMLECGMLRSLGVPYEVVTIACDPRQPGMFTHVYARAVIGANRIPLDASHGSFPGWEVPRQHTTRKQVWNERGEPIEDQARWSGLHGYARRGLGVCDPYVGCYEAGTFGGSSGTSPQTSSGGGWTSFFQGALNQGINLAGRVFAPQTTYQRGPNGQVLLQTPGSAPVFGADLLTSTTGAIPGWVWLAGGGVVLLMMFKGGKR